MHSNSKSSDGEMSFLEHLDVLRKHLFRSALVIAVFGIVAFSFNNILFDVILFGPLRPDFKTYTLFCKLSHALNMGNTMCFNIKVQHLQTLSVSEQFFNHMWIAFVAGLIIGFPFLLWELWRFVKPALRDKEIGPVRGFIVIASVLFIIGILFGYYILFPLSYNFLAQYALSDSGIVETHNTLDNYISMISTMTLVAGLIFEMPVLVYFLSRMTLITPAFMRKYRKHAVVVILIIAAVITPSPDVTSQMIVAIPMYLLYEISVFVSAWTIKSKKL